MTYDPVDMRVLWSDKRERAVYSIALDGGKRNTLLSASDGIGYVGSRRSLSVQQCHVPNVLVKPAQQCNVMFMKLRKCNRTPKETLSTFVTAMSF